MARTKNSMCSKNTYRMGGARDKAVMLKYIGAMVRSFKSNMKGLLKV
jgi:hypothetical protein